MIKKGFKVRSRQFRWWVWYWGRVAIAPFQLLFLKGHEQIRVRVRFWIAMFKIDRVRLLSFLNDLLW
ncbi:MAG: hypothetical protein MUF49_17665 [Oculatellaceae cyanobacterium Prado106]|nr:hypothetical protein [Oculatellaceae cyanobacterium Prado106]